MRAWYQRMASEPGEPAPPLSHSACLLSAAVVTFLLFGPYLARLMDEGNRISYMWARGDAVSVVLACLVPAVLFTLIHAALVRMGRPFLNRAWEHLLVVGFGAGLLANVCFWMQRDEGYRFALHGPETRTLWLILAAAVGYSMARPGSRLVVRTRQASQILAPVMLIVLVQLFRVSTYPTRVDALPVVPGTSAGIADAASGRGPVYLFILDGWSYQRSFADGLPIEDLPHLRDFSENAITLTDAHSMADHTATSLPRLIFQNNLPAVVQAEQAGFKRQDTFVKAEEYATIFDAARRQGYRTVLVGFSLPYERWLEGRVDAMRTYCRYPRGRHTATNILCHLLEASSYWTDPWSALAYRKMKTRVADRQILHGYERMRGDVLDVIREMPPDTMAFFHLPFPHYPYIVDENGDYRGPDETDWYSDCVEGYRRNLIYMDRMMGTFFEAMKRRGTWDEAMIIVTSDHTWRFDPDRASGRITVAKTHVPLLIKWPGQDDPVAVTQVFRQQYLGSIIEASLEGESLAVGLQQIERHLACEPLRPSDNDGSDPETIVRK